MAAQGKRQLQHKAKAVTTHARSIRQGSHRASPQAKAVSRVRMPGGEKKDRQDNTPPFTRGSRTHTRQKVVSHSICRMKSAIWAQDTYTTQPQEPSGCLTEDARCHLHGISLTKCQAPAKHHPYTRLGSMLCLEDASCRIGRLSWKMGVAVQSGSVPLPSTPNTKHQTCGLAWQAV